MTRSLLNETEFEAFVERFMDREKVPGLAIAISQEGEVIYQKGFGMRDLETKEPVSPTTIFGVASVTKSFTAMAIMQLVAEGKLALEDPVINHIPSFQLSDGSDSSRVQIRHLLSHTTGVPPLVRREDLTKLNDHLDYLVSASYELLGEPGEYISYCNDTFLLLGAIIERVTGRLYRRYVTDLLLEPLQMHRTTFSLEELARLQNVSVPYVKQAGLSEVKKADWPTLGNYEVGGGIRSNVLDLLKYGQLYVNGGRIHEKAIASEALLQGMWQPVHPLTRTAWYGYALRVVPNYAVGVTLVEHGGGQPGVSSNFGFVPEKGLVVAVLSNLDQVPIRDVWLAAVNGCLGFPLDQKEEREPDYVASPEELEKLVGTYRSAEGGHMSVFLREGNPVVDVAGTEFELRPSGSDTLVIKANEMPIRFFFKTEEKAWAALLGMRMLTRSE
ncbi:serine hydrolase domain-containing protein [Brevibacillus choshinensis]|uniref:serine hydrolase domain-containing protein n=1 Tax=Brevibacillus choshinensis TaxID=54911 RepID=UPI002E20A135|nr:serine hydrolase [Brevibacillus choshinensis]